MPVGIHGQGFIGIAFETVYGTYVPPTKYFPIKSENLKYIVSQQGRRVIRGLVDNVGMVTGFSHIEGDIEMELMEDALPYFMQVMRGTIVKTGTTDLTYTMTPGHSATGTTKVAMSITVTRAGSVFGYTGCQVSQLEIGTADGIPTMKLTFLGSDETTQSVPTPTWLATSIPFGAAQWSIQVPTASQVLDVQEVTATINDNLTPQYRLANFTKAAFVSFGQREVVARTVRDFASKTEYDLFKALTATSVTFEWTKSATKKVTLTLPNAIRETYDLDGLSDQGALHMAAVQFQGIYNTATSKAYELVVLAQENIT